MLGINRKNFWQGSDSNPEPIAWEPCCSKPTAAIYFWIKRVGNFGLTKKEKRLYWMNNFSCILHILRKIITGGPRGWHAIISCLIMLIRGLLFGRFRALVSPWPLRSKMIESKIKHGFREYLSSSKTLFDRSWVVLTEWIEFINLSTLLFNRSLLN